LEGTFAEAAAAAMLPPTADSWLPAIASPKAEVAVAPFPAMAAAKMEVDVAFSPGARLLQALADLVIPA